MLQADLTKFILHLDFELQAYFCSNIVSNIDQVTLISYDKIDGCPKWPLALLFCSEIDIEAELTTFAYYYIGIACAVIVFGYFQVNDYDDDIEYQ